jgi:hypothetical protein
MDPITIHEKIYGEYRIAEPVIMELLAAPSVQRLKGISQLGVPDRYHHLKGFSRYEHSVGVMLLLRSLGARLDEQIAGLLHDVSHTAFSHVVDWIIAGQGGQEGYQDEQHKRIIASSELAGILRKYGYDPYQIADESRFPLLEQESPKLCADRIDYTLRELGVEKARPYLASLAVADGRIIFTSIEAARAFASDFLGLQKGNWGSFESASRYTAFAQAVRYAIEGKIISFDDLWKDDEYVTHIMENAQHPAIDAILEKLKEKSLDHLPKSDGVQIRKFRHVDPDVRMEDGSLKRLSELDEEFARDLREAREENSRGIHVALFE